MTVSTTAPLVRVLVRGSNAWRITRHSDCCFVAKNNKGKSLVFDSEQECDSFWNFIEGVGFKLRTDKWSLDTLKKPGA